MRYKSRLSKRGSMVQDCSKNSSLGDFTDYEETPSSHSQKLGGVTLVKLYANLVNVSR